MHPARLSMLRLCLSDVQSRFLVGVRMVMPLTLLFLALMLCARVTLAQKSLSDQQRTKIDSIVTSVLAQTGAPSASIAVVLDERIVYERAYGLARIEPATPAAPAMRYGIGSVSKQFTATALLLLTEEKRLSLDDKVGRWLPNLTRANDVTIRQLLSMTAGYQDYWPQDYVFQAMLEPITPQGIFDRWARKPLDFEPGTKWQYSNTNYVIAGHIVEQASQMALFDFLQERVFTRLGMSSVKDIDAAPLGTEDAQRIMRNGLGPHRSAPKEAKGWLFGAGQLAMTAHDLALWNISVINQTILQPASYTTMQTDVLLADGIASRYGLGVEVNTVDGMRRISHGGAVSGYLTANYIFPDHRAAIVVFCNIYPGAAGPEAKIADRITTVLFQRVDDERVATIKRARRIFAGLQKGEIDHSLFTDNANAYFSEQVISDYASSFGALGTPTEFVQTRYGLRGGMVLRAFRFTCGKKPFELVTFALPDGKLEQYIVSTAE